MSSDDNETKLPEVVARALADARKGDASRSRSGSGGGPSGRWLAFVPVSIAAVMLALVMPRAAPPEEVPLPQLDSRALSRVEQDDAARAASARDKRLPDEVLAVGTALRLFQRAQAKATSTDEIAAARASLDHALGLLVTGGESEREAAVDRLVSLRAVQLDSFLTEVARFESTGVVSDELVDLGGAFVDRMRSAGWIDGQRVLLSNAERRATFKIVWSTIIGSGLIPKLAPTLDEQRVLYTLYLTRPHPPDAQRTSFAVQRRAAVTGEDCARVDTQERLAAEMWRADKIRKLGEIDPTYPTAYALGVAHYRAARYDQSVDAFRAWLDAHPDGPYTLRARNHLKAALAAYGP